jgi:hypothetical protein
MVQGTEYNRKIGPLKRFDFNRHIKNKFHYTPGSSGSLEDIVFAIGYYFFEVLARIQLFFLLTL